MEDTEKLYDRLISKIRSYNPKVHYKIIEKALFFSAKVHAGKKRESGEEYFMHCYEIANILADLKLDSHTIAAGLLHDVLDFDVKPEAIEREFDRETLELVKSVTKLKKVDTSISLEEEHERRAENIRKILLATSKDIRVILIKIADRLHNMRTLKFLPEEKRKIISQETMEIYAPIAHKLGMYMIKSELEDLAFRFLEPKVYQELKSRVAKKREYREKEVIKIIEFVKTTLKENDIPAEINGRAKHFFSIYKKIMKDNRSFEEIYDLIAIRIITENLNDCYKAFGLVHKLWPHMPERLKDYIAVPKSNGYQSIHTTVIIGQGTALEIQIRDKEMHRQAEEGIASHWRYKGDEQDKKFDRQIEWLKQFLEWKRDNEDSREFIESLKVDLFQKEIFVFTPKGDIISLAENATPIDFAYAVHTDIGNHCKSAKVNNVIVPHDFKLSPGDIVEIQTAKNAIPSRSWLSFVKSSSTIVKIKHALGIEVENKGRKKEVKSPYEKTLAFREGNIYFEGASSNVKIPKCCSPKPGDKIRAFKSKEGKIVVHKANCINLFSYDASREIKAQVSEHKGETYKLRASAQDRLGLLSDILHVIAQEKQNVRQLDTKFGKNDIAIITIELIASKDYDPTSLMDKISKIRSVNEVILE
ncbi:TPA: bifunctional (p)ppGpp synthetase/guanosine-3',5'-bis(diphosphate) 3'-pyrophosphohydrolase [Candidatus Woesearchaeota archaeon]|nr:bifunctional (p)ppGpp synthetase/guanosine-3',5'-bis(diphosphate) 3'-pyrophosphohydrolase [Candidatus Woesearchaeota archaeon]HIH31219.1 bifunctional (p)ppGpp synthetase/guanosine-3',5'-bis(diphosphate) 3'-pyrophosphohydrolase [Candidatus Woesearchaeota archaeon]HIH54833.1 bifunctional (p)ppGpp synthetase/guanosine-3',5'-bis(diphosphate) 3'-pyrophosphohydrolase [Candidatus Woesearchaeota archaeon]HIJ01628.1 bifunctional (p)ppGpp synthetase/guanosine-3',5'-bis(diphosphate) 3'-pyrophosphohydrol